MSDSFSIPGRFNGPRNSGNGGYSSGVIAGFVEGLAEVNLRAPVPLDVTLRVVHEDDGSVSVRSGAELIAEARPIADIEMEEPDPVSPAEARGATASYRGEPDGAFSCCFVCGLAREDAFGVHSGVVPGRGVVASPWTPPGWAADEAGRVLPEYVWAVLDCPTYFALYQDGELPLSMLARFSARIDAPIAAGEEHVVTGWPIEIDGRKHHAGSAILSAAGDVLAVGRALLIGPRPE